MDYSGKTPQGLLDPILTAAVAHALGYTDPKDTTAYPEVEATDYQPTEDEKNTRAKIVKCMASGYTTQYRPRVEFNDLSLVDESTASLMAFNTYQPADGAWAEGDVANNWRSNALRPVERNKVMSMAGHVAGRLGFLKLVATDEGSNLQEDAADVINSLMEYVRVTYFTPEQLLGMVLASLYHPKCFVHEEFSEVYRPRKKAKVNGKWEFDWRLDETASGFITTVVPPDQLFLENVFERDIQKQGWLIWRRVQSFDTLQAKYANWKNWDKVRPGMHLVYNDPNASFYYVYDPHLWGEMGEEIVYWDKSYGGCKVTMVNGVIIGEWDAPNPREDGLYPFAAWGYQMIRTNFLYDKSLVSSVKQDARVLNTLYPLIIDGAVLATIPPTVATGSEIIGSDVIIPGLTTTLRDKDAVLKPIMQPPDIGKSMLALNEVEKSLDQTANVQPFSPDKTGNITAYQISVMEQQKEEAIGPFRDSLLSASAQLTKLVMGDVLQHFTAIDADKITDNTSLVYRTFLAPHGQSKKRIKFEDMSKSGDKMKESYKTLEEQGGKDAIPLYRVDPVKFRDLKFQMMLSDDVLKPKSENVRYQRDLEIFDKGIVAKQAGANVDLDGMFKDFVLVTSERASRNPDKYVQAQSQNPLQALGLQPSATSQALPQPPGASQMPSNAPPKPRVPQLA